MKWSVFVGGLLAIAIPLFLHHRARDPEASVNAGEPAAVARSPETGFSKWETHYENASLEQVTQEVAMLRDLLDQGTGGYYEEEFARGNYVVEGQTSPDGSYSLPAGDELCARRFLHSGEVTKVTLPRDQFQEMYELRDQIEWLVHREAELAYLDRLARR
jgi:hypothetical protein